MKLPRWPGWRTLSRRRRYTTIACALALCVLLALYAQVREEIREASAGRLYTDVQRIPARQVGLVLGTSRRLRGGEPNLFFVYRIDSAIALYQAGKVRYLLVSGDNRKADYDEPAQMREALLARGIPAQAIYCDYAGITTLDSVIRAREVFGLDADLTFISQGFHNQRALYLAQHHGLEAIAFNAPDVNNYNATRTLLRERGARLRAWWDVHVARRQARHLGAMIPIGSVPSSCNA